MLGSLDDAEDALQDTFLHVWRGLSGFEGRSALRRWLFRIATNACLDAIARRPKRVMHVDYGPQEGAPQGILSADAPWMEPYPDRLLGREDGYAAPEGCYEQREAVELAFVMAIKHLPPRQRAALVLRDVLGFSAKEVSQLLCTTVTSVNSVLQRARKVVDERVPENSQEATVRALGASGHEIVERFVDAFERGDVEAIVALLAEDAGSAMPRDPRRAVTPTSRGPRKMSLARFGLPSELAA
jgi:RNA polymerase sigma-70 factor, ECF subfamily